MALAPDDLLTPTGRVDAALFYPSATESQVTTRLGAYLSQGYDVAMSAGLDEATSDALASAFAYWRAWDDVAQRMLLAPASATLQGEGSTTRLASQIAEWIAQRDQWKADYLALIPDTSGSTVRQSGTRALTNEYNF